MESATVMTMRAAIEAAGAADHKRRATRSVAAQTILDSGSGQVKVAVTSVGAANDIDDGSGGDGGGVDGVASTGSGGEAETSYDGSYYRFGRVRRIAAALLRDLGTMVDARQNAGGVAGGGYSGAIRGDRSVNSGGGHSPRSPDSGVGAGYYGNGSRRGSHSSAGAGAAGGGSGGSGNVEAAGVEKLVERFELLEDELASASARRAQSEAQSKVLLATLQKANNRVDRC